MIPSPEADGRDTLSPGVLAVAIPPRQFHRINPVPGREYLQRTLDTDPGDRLDTGRMICAAAMLLSVSDAQERPMDSLAATFFFEGARWPVPIRLAVLEHCGPALWLEQRLAALAARREPSPEE